MHTLHDMVGPWEVLMVPNASARPLVYESVAKNVLYSFKKAPKVQNITPIWKIGKNITRDIVTSQKAKKWFKIDFCALYGYRSMLDAM